MDLWKISNADYDKQVETTRQPAGDSENVNALVKIRMES